MGSEETNLSQRLTHSPKAPLLRPAVNWWPGNTLPFESSLAVAAKFCALNGTSLREFEDFVEIRVDSHTSSSETDIARIALALNEHTDDIRSVFIPEIHLSACHHYRLPYLKTASAELRYCQQCIESGYHSYLHEAAWLAKCPIHFTELKSTFCSSSGISNNRKRLKGLTELFKSNCQTWPRPLPSELKGYIGHNHRITMLKSWTIEARKALSELSEGQIWHSDVLNFVEENSYWPSICRLRSLVEVPKPIEALFVTTGESWEVESYIFPREVKIALDNALDFAPVSVILNFFKGVGIRADASPSFVTKLRQAQENMRLHHHSCRCRWGIDTGSGYYRHWIRTGAEGWPRWGYKCPHQFAVDELEIGWGNPENVMSSRRAQDELLRFVKLSHLMHDAGLIEYLPNANVSPEGKLYYHPQEWPCCRWNEASLLTPLFSKISEFEVESAVHSLRNWLDEIDRGGEPHDHEKVVGWVRLCKCEEGLRLIRWVQRSNQS